MNIVDKIKRQLISKGIIKKGINKNENIQRIKEHIKGTIILKKKDSFLTRIYYKYRYLFYIYVIKPLEEKPSAEKMLRKSLDIIRNYENSRSFNKIEMYRVLGKRRKTLNIYYYLFSKYFSQPEKLINFIPKKYIKFTDFFVEQSVQKTKQILYYFINYFESNGFLKRQLRTILASLAGTIFALGAYIYMVFYMNFYFLTQLVGMFKWDDYYSRVSTLERFIFDNTMYLGFIRDKNAIQTLGLKKEIVYQGILNNIFFWVGFVILIALVLYITYYVISQYNMMKIFKYVNERNFNIWFQVQLERIKMVQVIESTDDLTGNIKKNYVTRFENIDIYKLFNKNLNKLYQYKLINYQTKQKLFFMSIMNRKNQGKAVRNDKFFSEGFRVFWTELFDLVNKGSQSRFNYGYLEKQLKARYRTFDELWKVEVNKITEILSYIFLILAFFFTMKLVGSQFQEIHALQQAIEIYRMAHGGAGGL